MYLVAIMDWYSRRVLSWRVSNTLDADFCIEALEDVSGCVKARINGEQWSPLPAVCGAGDDSERWVGV